MYDISTFAERGLSPCTKTFSETMGFPCKHDLRTISRNNSHLEMSHFNKLWWLQRPRPVASQQELDLPLGEIRLCLRMLKVNLNPSG
ncbi:unnamed protein product [Albugo candida]|uniref:Uncharacterized protein n=1 Tax=Albugo candida TaxID=65357 RepID=A0A024FT12_9STRA|nr:unnamed protein product [Albugo candida]|eukprot:CCI10220.1 unnamed protein product [Albugo candida]